MDELWNRWDLRERRWSSANSKKQFLTPTALLKLDHPEEYSGTGGLPAGTQGTLVGTLAHRILEAWDYSNGFEQIHNIMRRISQCGLMPELAQDSGDLQNELLDIFKVFTSSEPYRNIQRATIVGREIPFVIPWDCWKTLNQDIKNQSSVMEGVIDLVYKLDGCWWIADYKTDRFKDGIPADLPTKHAFQARIYQDAVAQSLGLTQLGCQLIYIRHGISIELQ